MLSTEYSQLFIELESGISSLENHPTREALQHSLGRLKLLLLSTIQQGIDYENEIQHLTRELRFLNNVASAGADSVGLPPGALFTASEILTRELIINKRQKHPRDISALCSFLKLNLPAPAGSKDTATGVRGAYSGAQINEHNERMRRVPTIRRINKFIKKNPKRPTREIIDEAAAISSEKE